jgi:hypothetical protein
VKLVGVVENVSGGSVVKYRFISLSIFQELDPACSVRVAGKCVKGR